MISIEKALSRGIPRTIQEALDNWPRREKYYASSGDWRDEVFYFLLVDRFSDGKEKTRPLLKADLSTQGGIDDIRAIRGRDWKWDKWAQSGSGRFQGGTLGGVTDKLTYLRDLGVTTLWLSPIFRQRVEENTYHGYGIQNFLEVDERFGSRSDLVELVNAAHGMKMRVILDVIFNHSGCNWLYDQTAGNIYEPAYKPVGYYQPTWPRNGMGQAIFDPAQALGADDYVLPEDLGQKDCYLCAGKGNLGSGRIDDPEAEHKRTDFFSLRKFNLSHKGSDSRIGTMESLIIAYQYWIALADLDGMRIDTFKHVSYEQARDFCNAIKEYSEVLGKDDFFLVAEIAGGDNPQDSYLSVTGRNLNACLDIGEQREALCGVAKGDRSPSDFFAGFNYYDPGMGSHRNWGSQHLSVCNDHDHVFGPKIRFAADALNDHQATAAMALQLFALGIPCLYYGTEQGLASGAESSERQWLPSFNADWLLRETMFGPEHPRASGWNGAQGKIDEELPGFGPHGTCGRHVFNPDHPIYTRIALMADCRRKYKPLRRGRQYRRPTSFCQYPFDFHGKGEILAWSRVFDDQEALVIVNTCGKDNRGARIVIDGRLCGAGMKVACNTDPSPGGFKKGAEIASKTWDGQKFIELDQLGPSEVIVLVNKQAEEASQWIAT